MDHKAIAQDIVKAVREHAKEYNTELHEQWRGQWSDYIRDYMPYDKRINEPRDYEAETIVADLVEEMIEEIRV